MATEGNEVYAEFIAKELDRQTARKTSFEQRGLSVITTSGALVTLLFGLAALSTKQQDFRLPSTAKVLLLIAIAVFVLAIAAALATNVPLVYQYVTPGGLSEAVKKRWLDSPSAARETVANTQITAIRSAREINGKKGLLLFGAIACELVAVGLVAVAIGFVIYQPADKPAGARPTGNDVVTVIGSGCGHPCSIARLHLFLPQPGVVVAQQVAGPVSVAPTKGTVSSAAPMILTMPVRATARRLVEHGRAVHVAVLIRFTPKSGAIAEKTMILTLASAPATRHAKGPN